MSHVCPIWVGRLLASPVRKLLENPTALFAPHVRESMTVLEPGPGMGFFTLPLARLVGDSGRVIAVDVQERMLEALRGRAAKAGLSERIDCRLAGDGLDPLADLESQVDFAAAIHMVHETPDPAAFIASVARTLKPGARFLVREPRFHVSAREFADTLRWAEDAGLRVLDPDAPANIRQALFEK